MSKACSQAAWDAHNVPARLSPLRQVHRRLRSAGRAGPKSLAGVDCRIVSALQLSMVAWGLSLLVGCGAWVPVQIPSLPSTRLLCDAVEVTLLDGQHLRLEHATISPPDLQGEVVWVGHPTTRIELGLSRLNQWHGDLSTVGTLHIRTTTFGQKSALIREDQALSCWNAR